MSSGLLFYVTKYQMFIKKPLAGITKNDIFG